MQIAGTFIAKDTVMPGQCLLLGPAGPTGLRPVIWYGRIDQIEDKTFMSADQIVVHTITYERIKAAVAQREEGIPYVDQPSET